MSAGRDIHLAFKAWLGEMPTLPDPQEIADEEWPDVAAALAAAAIVTREVADKIAACALDALAVGEIVGLERKLWVKEWERRLKEDSQVNDQHDTIQ